MKKTKKISLAALCAALGVICLYLGSMVEILDMSAALLASVFVCFCVWELGFGYGGTVYLIISLLALLLLPQKSPAILFALLFGYIPITKFFFEKIPQVFSWICKLLLFNLMFGAVVFLGAELLGFTTENAFGIPAFVFYIGYFVLANAVYVLCDILFARLARVYFFRVREKIQKYLK